MRSAVYDLCFVGFGHVAQRLVTLIEEQRRRLAREHAVGFRFVGAVTRHHGRLHAPGGVSGAQLLTRMRRAARTAESRDGNESVPDFIRRVARASPHTRAARFVVLETTTLDVKAGQPATDHIVAALRAGAHVVTANKGPVACAYQRISRAAARAGRRFLFEAAVMDGIPVFNFVRENLPAVRVTGFRGVVNSTTNFILTAMEKGEPFDAALAAMQREGIAEADASLDVDGWDAAAKTAALCNVLLDAGITPHQVTREGIGPATGERAVRAVKAGHRVKLVATARRQGSGVDARVAPAELPSTDLLAGLEGQQNAVVLETDLLGEVAIVQRGSGLTQTAYGLLSDLVTIARDSSRSPRAVRRSRTPSRRRRR